MKASPVHTPIRLEQNHHLIRAGRYRRRDFAPTKLPQDSHIRVASIVDKDSVISTLWMLLYFQLVKNKFHTVTLNS